LIVWYLTFNCYLDLELTHGQHGFWTFPCWGEHFSQVWRKSFNWYRIYRADTIMETDGRTDGKTRQSESIIATPPPFCNGGIITTSTLIEYNIQVIIFFIIDLLFFLVFIWILWILHVVLCCVFLGFFANPSIIKPQEHLYCTGFSFHKNNETIVSELWRKTFVYGSFCSYTT